MFHGMGEHIGRYDHVFSAFANAGILTTGIDYMGHGRTQVANNSLKGDLEFETVFEQMDQIMLNPPSKDLPLILMGHSLGGLLVLAYAKSRGPKIRNLRGVISQAPALKIFVATPAALLARLLGGSVLSRIQISNRLPLDKISTDKQVMKDYQNDPLTHSLVTLRTFKEFLTYGSDLRSSAKDFKYPIIIYHSPNDTFTDIEGSEEFMSKVGSTDKTFEKIIGNWAHELHNDPGRERVIQDYISWITKRASMTLSKL
jgi:acylglycerol lipase